jgi:thioredoxin-like negative regulator of GroEL
MYIVGRRGSRRQSFWQEDCGMGARLLCAGGSLAIVLGIEADLWAATSVPLPPEPAQSAAAPAPKLAKALVPAPRLRHGVFRFTSYPAAWTAAQKTNRPILVFVTSQSCPHCTKMLGETYQRAAVRQFVADSFETVFVDRTEQPELAAKLRVRWYPTTLVVGPDNQVIDMIEGYVDSASFARRLQTSLAAQSAATQTR